MQNLNDQIKAYQSRHFVVILFDFKILKSACLSPGVKVTFCKKRKPAFIRVARVTQKPFQGFRK